MIYVIATIELKTDCRERFLEIFRRNVPNVRAEKGCLVYAPTVDLDTGLAAQGGHRADGVTIIESWTNLAALRAHLEAPHMQTYREEVKDLVERLSLKVLDPV